MMQMFNFLKNWLDKEEEENEDIPYWFSNNNLCKEKSFLLDDIVALKLYGSYLRKAGHCPKCNDFLFIDIFKEEEHYKVIKECVNHNCDFKENISKDFNSELGIDYNDLLVIQTPPTDKRLQSPYDYALKVESGQSIPSSTGTLRRSFDKEVSRNAFGVLQGFNHDKYFTKRLVTIVTELPKASKETMNSIYCISTDYGHYKLYDTYYSNKQYYWMELKEGEIDISAYYNINKRKYEYSFARRVSK